MSTRDASWRIFLCLLLIPLFFFLYKIYIARIAAFGCFDDCFNYGAGFFLTKGKHLYSEIFFNHQPLPAYLTAIIQTITKPENIYALLLRHRQLLLLWALIWNAFYIIRFGSIGLGFSLLYETTKFYIFGDRFLAEGIIVYPLVYLCALVWNTLLKKPLRSAEQIFALICSWFIIFMREPFIPLALFLLGILVILEKSNRKRFWIILGFTALTILTVLHFPLHDYFFNVITINKQTVLADSINESKLFGPGIIPVFFYPITLFFGGTWNVFRHVELLVSMLFLISSVYLFINRYMRLPIIVMWIILGLANLRVVPVGNIYYGSFHLLPWYGIFIFLTLLFIQTITTSERIRGVILSIGCIFIVLYIMTSQQIFFRERIDPHEEFITNYGAELQIGNLTKALLKNDQTLFLDGWAELIYWQADRVSPYTYIWYTSVMPMIPLYADARIEMFQKTPPDLYYGTCPKEQNSNRILPDFVQPLYQNILSNGSPSCVWIKKTVVSGISDQQWQKASELLFEKPTNKTL